jgi:hypothetical protein
MPQINQLAAVDQVQPGDQVPIYSSSNGDARKASLALLKAFFQEGITAADDKITQYSAPSATAFSIQVNDNADSVWLVLTPTAGFAAGTLVLPAVANCVDRQEVLVNCTQAVTTLTVSGNGATVTGAPTALTANGFFRLRFDAITDTWYRVG